LVVTVVSWNLLKDIAVNKFRKPTIFSEEKLCYKFSTTLVNAEKYGAKSEKRGPMPTCYRWFFMCCSRCLPNFHCF